MTLLPMKTFLFVVINVAVIKAAMKTYQTSTPFKLTAQCNYYKNVRAPFITDHGCWCQGYNSTEKPILGKPVTELDRLCQTYHRCLHCVTNDAICSGEDTTSYDADAPVGNDCTQVVCSTGNKCQQHVCECTAALSTGIEAIPDTLYNDRQYQSYQSCDRSSRAPTGANSCPSFGPQVPQQCSGLTGGLLTDHSNNGLTETAFNNLVQTLTLPFYIRRVRQIAINGRNEYKDTIYKRRTAVPAGYNMFTLFRSYWRSASNAHHTDFDIFDNMVDAVADQNAWRFCNYDDPGVGYPRDCGQTGGVGNQWISSTRGGNSFRTDWAFHLADC